MYCVVNIDYQMCAATLREVMNPYNLQVPLNVSLHYLAKPITSPLISIRRQHKTMKSYGTRFFLCGKGLKIFFNEALLECR